MRLAITFMAAVLVALASRETLDLRTRFGRSDASLKASLVAGLDDPSMKTAGRIAQSNGLKSNERRLLGQEQTPRNGSSADGKRSWHKGFFLDLKQARQGDLIQFELLHDQVATARIRHVKRLNGDVIYISGKVESPESGRFFFQKQTRPGVAGEFVGLIEFPGSGTALRIEPTGPGGSSELVRRRLSEVVC
ncbi:MAG TPA: hypothetical protein VL793_03875, partial [Patescibacteria group bacterium]|nr:hypothetical protein [Patescibacteria group bacterium]